MNIVSSTHLTYCTNIHPAETLTQVIQSLRRHTTAVKRELAWTHDFSVGLRLSHQAASELLNPAALDELAGVLDEHGLYVVTLNGFPYGQFHGEPVKDSVYLPDWSSTERLSYTRTLIRILSGLLRPGHAGSISTVPGAYKAACISDTYRGAIVRGLLQACADLVSLERETGQLIRLALEPEPCCILETAEETISFFQDELLSADAQSHIQDLTGCLPSATERLIRRHLGVCLDTCHAAVEFESPRWAFERLERAGLGVAKVQVSAGLRLDPRSREQRSELAKYDEPIYLHQVVVRNQGRLERFEDLGVAFDATNESSWADDAEWRVHFHVPVFTKDCGSFESTQSDLPPLLAALGKQQAPPHVEVETYTWGVLPAQLQTTSLERAIADELRWTLKHLTEP